MTLYVFHTTGDTYRVAQWIGNHYVGEAIMSWEELRQALRIARCEHNAAIHWH